MRDMVLWLAFTACFAGLVIVFRESWSSALFLLCYGILYGSASASREHEAGHMTAFKTKRWNTLFHHIASLMLLRERFARLNGHHAHHKHTIHTEKDPEIVTPNPPKILAMILNLLQIQKTAVALRSIGLCAFGLLAPEDAGMLFKRCRGQCAPHPKRGWGLSCYQSSPQFICSPGFLWCFSVLNQRCLAVCRSMSLPQLSTRVWRQMYLTIVYIRGQYILAPSCGSYIQI